MFEVPILDERNVLSSAHAARPTVIGAGSPPKGDGIGRKIVLELLVLKEWGNLLGKFKIIIICTVWSEDGIFMRNQWNVFGERSPEGNRVNNCVEKEGGQVPCIRFGSAGG